MVELHRIESNYGRIASNYGRIESNYGRIASNYGRIASNYGRYNSVGRVSGCGSGSHGFKSRYLPIFS